MKEGSVIQSSDELFRLAGEGEEGRQRKKEEKRNCASQLDNTHKREPVDPFGFVPFFLFLDKMQ